MSDEGRLPDPTDFALIETLAWTRGGGFALLDEHFARLAASAAALGFAYDRRRAEAALERCVGGDASLRVRLDLARDGGISAAAAPFTPPAPETVWTLRLADTRLRSDDPMLRHKTSRRAFYEDALSRSGADEVLFLNERGELCEGARSNLFVRMGGRLVTPAIACGLLPGTLRARMLALGEAEEAVLHWSALSEAKAIYMGNSVRGLVRARIVD